MRAPAWPEVPSSQRSSTAFELRFNDVCQDGRVLVTTLPEALSVGVWLALLHGRPMTEACIVQGIIPILTRLVVQREEGQVPAQKPVEVRGAYALAHTVDARGEVDRLLLRMWADVTGKSGRTYGAQPADVGAPVAVGRVFADHVFTRLFASPGDRRVTKLALPGVPEVPDARGELAGPDEVLGAPEGARALGDAGFDDAPFVFGLSHTDPNLHVNSLVYPALFEGAALRLLAKMGRPVGGLLSRELDILWRKPCFAGDVVRVRLQAFEHEGGLTVSGTLHPEADHVAKPYCYVRLVF